MVENREQQSGQVDAWKRNPMPGEAGENKDSNIVMIALIISAIGLLIAIGFI